MNKPQKQTVYLPVKVQGADGNYIPDESVLLVKEQGEMDKYWDALVKPQEGYFFTPEQLNEYTANVIKQALETAAEKAKINYKEDGEVTKVKSKRLDIDYLSEVSSKVSFNINTESITNTFEETYQKLKV